MHKVTNNSKALQGVQTVRGVAYIRPGHSREVELTPVGYRLATRLKFLDVKGAAPKTETKPDHQPDDAPKAPFEAKEKGRGWWAIFDADSKEVTKSLREDDVKGFSSLSAEDKAIFVDRHKAD